MLLYKNEIFFRRENQELDTIRIAFIFFTNRRTVIINTEKIGFSGSKCA